MVMEVYEFVRPAFRRLDDASVAGLLETWRGTVAEQHVEILNSRIMLLGLLALVFLMVLLIDSALQEYRIRKLQMKLQAVVSVLDGLICEKNAQ